MNNHYQTNDEQIYDKDEQMEYKSNIQPHYSPLYFITHIILSFFAIYLSWRCGGAQFNILHFIAALCCPHFYIIWALATRGGCGIFDKMTV